VDTGTLGVDLADLVLSFSTYPSQEMSLSAARRFLDPGSFFYESGDVCLVDIPIYRNLVEILMWLLQTQSDIHKDVNVLLRRVASPLMGDMAKVVRELCHLNSCPDIGPTEEGPVLSAHVDAE
jgi:hypothetical protein